MRMAMSLQTLAMVFLSSVTASTLVTEKLPEAGLIKLETMIRPMYEALPRGAGGLPEASGVRYLARRFLARQSGLSVSGLDLVPAHAGPNASGMAAARAQELLRAPAGLPAADAAALAAVLGGAVGRGFGLREAAQFVHAVELIVSNANIVLMRKAHTFSKRASGKVSPKLPMLLRAYAVLYMAGDHADSIITANGVDPLKLLEHEVSDLQMRLRGGVGLEPLEQLLAAAAGDAARSGRVGGAKAREGMRRLRERLDGRHARECGQFHSTLKSMDPKGTGQVQFVTSYGTSKHDWALLETPEYLRALGALEERSSRGVGPGVLIPNYVVGMSGCRVQPDRLSMVCCPDKCESEVLPRLEAVVGGHRASPKQVWLATRPVLQAEGARSAAALRALSAELRELALRSRDRRLAVHGRRLAGWLHRAFPHTCRKPTAPRSGAPRVVDPALTLVDWTEAGHVVPLEPEVVQEVRAHLSRRWGPDGAGEGSVESFAARSPLDLDQELRLINQFHEAHKAGGPRVEEALEDAINVRLFRGLDSFTWQVLAMVTAMGMLCVLLPLLARGRCAVAAARAAAVPLLKAAGGEAWRAHAALSDKFSALRALLLELLVELREEPAPLVPAVKACAGSEDEAETASPVKEQEDSTDAGEADSDANAEPSSDSEVEVEGGQGPTEALVQAVKARAVPEGGASILRGGPERQAAAAAPGPPAVLPDSDRPLLQRSVPAAPGKAPGPLSALASAPARLAPASTKESPKSLSALTSAPLKLAPSWQRSVPKAVPKRAGDAEEPPWRRPAAKLAPKPSREDELMSWRQSAAKLEPRPGSMVDSQLSWRRPASKTEAGASGEAKGSLSRCQDAEHPNHTGNDLPSWRQMESKSGVDIAVEAFELLSFVCHQLKDM